MNMRLRNPLYAWLAAAGLALAPGLAGAQEPGGAGTRFYGGVDYLLWWVKGAPLNVPLVSTGPVATTHHGWLENSDATVLYGSPFPPARGGNDTQNFPAFSGGRLTVGYFLDEEGTFGVEGGGFVLGRRSAGYEIRAGSDGLPIINIPVFNTISYSPIGRAGGLPPNEDGLPASLPNDPARFDGNNGIFTGGVKITNSLRLWGSELMGLVNLFREDSWELSAVTGFRYLDLMERFDLIYDSEGLTGFYVGQVGAAIDSFQTRNQFYGGTLGLRGRYLSGPLSVDLGARVSLGASHQVIKVSGGFYSYGYIGPFRSGPEGVFAQPANEGRRSSDRLAVLPEAQLKVGYAVTSWLVATVGYDVLYYNNVVRPGDEINRQIPKGQTFQQGQAPPSPLSPVPLFNTTDFFAHGLSFGLDFRF